MRCLLVGSSVLCTIAAVSLALGVRVNFTPSVSRGLYRSVEGTAATGDLVAVCLPTEISRFGLQRGYLGSGSCDDGAMPVLKFVLAVAGDEVQLEWASVTISGRGSYRLQTLTQDSSGRALRPTSRGQYRLAPGDLWLVSAGHERSWDSRYYGAVPAAAVRSVFVPMLMVPGDASGWPGDEYFKPSENP